MSAPADARQLAAGGDGPEGQPEHAVNVSRGVYRYSLGLAEWSRAVYQHQTSPANEKYWQRRSDLPYVSARVIRRDGSARRVGTDYLISAEPGGAPAVVTDDDLTTGGWAVRIGANLSSDRDIISATGTAIRDVAHRTAPEREATPRPDVHSESGHLDVPVAECLPDGYLTMPPLVTGEQARATWRDVVALLAELPKLALTVGASAGSPFVGPLRRQSHWWDLYGEKRKGKSTTLEAAAAVWGDPRTGTGIKLNWDASSIGTGRHLGQLGILPPFLDERGAVRRGRDEWGELIYQTSQGSSRLTAERLGTGTRRSAPWFGVLFSSGNARLTEGITAGRFAGVPARVIELPAPLTRSKHDSDRLSHDLLPRCYGWLGPEVLRTHPVPAVRELIAQAELSIGVPETGGVPGTLAEHLHLAVAGAAMVDAVLGTGTQLTDAATIAAIEYLAEHGQEPEQDADQMLDALSESLVSRRPAWPTAAEYAELANSRPLDPMSGAGRPQLAQHGYDQQTSGVRSDDGQWLYVFPATWHAIAETLGLDESTACTELHRRELLHVPAGARREGRWHSQVRGSGVKLGRVYQVAMTGLERGDDQGTVPAPVLPPAVPAVTVPAVPAEPVEPCAACAVPGQWCGFGAAGSEPAPCAACGVPTLVRSACGAPRTAQCSGVDVPAPVQSVQPVQPAPPAPRGAHPAAQARDGARVAISASAAAAVASGDPLRLLDALEGAYAPLRKVEGRMRAPYWRPELPGITFAAQVVTGWDWSRPYTGPVSVLDRSGAWVAAASSATVGHGALEHTGELEQAGRPGYCQLAVYRWEEKGLPNPLGHVPAGAETLWVPTPTAVLIRDLAAAGRWPDATVLDSYTAEPVRLDKWTTFVNGLRAFAINGYGRDSEEYIRVKEAFGQAMSLMVGSISDSGTRREWKCGVHRPDWTHTIQAQGSATLWRWADDCRQMAPDLAPVAVRNVDELVVPTAAVDIVTTTPRPGARKPMVIDPAGITLGSFKVKGSEEWRGGRG